MAQRKQSRRWEEDGESLEAPVRRFVRRRKKGGASGEMAGNECVK